jgi:hypothetical protein
MEDLTKRAESEVLDRLACRSHAPGPVNWFGLSCAVGTLYRHYVELLLKLIVVLCQRLGSKESSFPKNHDLNMLWDEARDACLGLCPKPNVEDQEALNVAEKQVRWLSEHDPSSQVFRYPALEGTSKDKALPDLQELCEHVVPLGNYLRQVALGLWDMRHNQRDIEEDLAEEKGPGPIFS